MMLFAMGLLPLLSSCWHMVLISCDDYGKAMHSMQRARTAHTAMSTVTLTAPILQELQ